MKLAFIALSVLLAQAKAQHKVDSVLKSEIEVAAAESRHLADELSGMLDRLEVEEERGKAVDAAVLGEQEEVEEALKQMVEKIENLAKASEDSSTETVTGLVKKKRVKENELRKTLEQLELVAGQIEEAADSADSIEDVNTIEKIARLLQSISDKVETNNRNNEDDNDDEEVFIKQFAKDQSQTGLELNGIAEMIKSLEKVTKDLQEDDDDDQSDEEEEREDQNVEKDKDQDNDDDQDTSNRLQNFLKNRKSSDSKQEARGGKNLDLEDEDDSSSLDSTASRLLDVLDLEDFEETDKSSGVQEDEERSDKSEYEEEERSGKSDEEDIEECETNTPEDRVRICLPKAKTARSAVQLPSAKVEEVPVCLDVSRAVCNESSAVLSREVCTYQYTQQEVLAPVQSAELTYQPRVEKMGVTR